MGTGGQNPSQSGNTESKHTSIFNKIKIKLINEKDAILKLSPLRPATTLKDEKPSYLEFINNPTYISQLTASNGIGCELCTIVLSAAKVLVENDVDDVSMVVMVKRTEYNGILSFFEKTYCDFFTDSFKEVED